VFDKNDAIKTLELINSWTNNCDTKAAVILGGYGVFGSVFLAMDYASLFRCIIHNMLFTPNLGGIIYVISVVISAGLLIFGLFRLVRVLVPRIDKSSDSVMFFGLVAENKDFDEYKLKIENLDEDAIMKDILHQIFAASKICKQKFADQKYGLWISGIGFILLLVLFFIGSLTLLTPNTSLFLIWVS